MRKLNFRLCENKAADQLRSNCEADQRLCFRYTYRTISLLNPKFQASSLLLCLYSSVCVRPGRKPRRPVFSRRGSNGNIESTSEINRFLQTDKHFTLASKELSLSLGST